MAEYAEGWSTDPCKNFFGQMIVSDVSAFKDCQKMQIFDHPLSNLSLPVGRTDILVCATKLDLY